MELERHYLGAWDGVQRQGQVVVECLASVAQGLGGILQSHMPHHIPPLPAFLFSSGLPSFSMSLPSPHVQLSSLPSQWPWSSPIDNFMHLAGSGFGSDMKLAQSLNIDAWFSKALSFQHLGQDVSVHVGQAGATVGAYLSDLAGGLMQRFSGPTDKVENHALHSFRMTSLTPLSNVHTDSARVLSEGKQVDVGSQTKEMIIDRITNRKNVSVEDEDSLHDLLTIQRGQDLEDLADEEVPSKLAVSTCQSGNCSSAFVSTIFSSRTQNIETSVVARGDLWRVEAT